MRSGAWVRHWPLRTLVLELNVLCVRGGLAGDTPHERYHHFLRRLQHPAFALGVLREYPGARRDGVPGPSISGWRAGWSSRTGWSANLALCGNGAAATRWAPWPR